MNKKKLWILISGSLAVLAIAAAVVLLVLFGGKGAQTPTPTVPGATVSAEPYLELNESKITLDVHNDITLQCTASGVTEPVVWTSSDSAIASVDNGKVVALKTGETVISATAGSYSAKCTVTVVDNGVVPAFADYTGAFEIRRTNTYDVSPRILFAGSQKSLTDASLTYQVADSTVAQIDEKGIATALKEGTTEFTVSGSFRGIPMAPISGTIVVKKNIVIALNSLNIQLFACNPDGSYQTSYQLKADVYIEEKLEQGAALVWSSEDEKIATVADGLIQAVRAGETMIHAVYTTPDGDEIKAGIQVQVQRPIIEMEGLQEFDLSNKNGSSTLDFGQLNSYVDGILTGFYDITEEKQELSGASWKGGFSVPNKSFTEHGYRRYAVESELASIHFDGLAITRKIYSVADLRAISTSSDTLDGYYRLERDIDAGGSTIALCIGWTNTSSKGFIGTFEGNGHTISNLRVGSTGLFNCIGEATIRNLGLANVSGSGSVLASEVHQATIENIAVSSSNCERVFNYVGQRSKIANVIAVLENGKYFITTYGSAADAESTVQNLMVVAGRAEANNGWSGTRVPGVFFNYYQKDDPAELYDLDMYKTKEEMIVAMISGNELADFDFGMRLDGTKLYYNDALICRYELAVQAPATVHRGSSCRIKAENVTFKLKYPVSGISVDNESGVVLVAGNVPEFTQFAVVLQHKEYEDVRAEVTLTVTIYYKVVKTEMVARYDLSTNAASYTLTIPGFTDTFKRLGWQGTIGFAEGITVENGTFTLSSDAVKALGTGDGMLCVYTEEERVFYVDLVIADKFLYTYEDLAALYQAKVLDGYYMLAADIEANNKVALTLIGTWTNKSSEGFVGTLNGDGHSISNLKVGTPGLFGYIGTGSIKNLALINVTGGVSVLANEVHGGTFTNLFISSEDAVRVFNYAEASASNNIVAVMPSGKHFIATNGSATVGNTNTNIYVVMGNPVTNNGWSGTKVVGFFENYYSFNNPKTLYNLKHYYTAKEMLTAMAGGNLFASWSASSFSYRDGGIYFGEKLVLGTEIKVTGPHNVHRGQSVTLIAENATFAIKEPVDGITVEANGKITARGDVAEFTTFTVVVTHKQHTQFSIEWDMTVTIDYKVIDKTGTMYDMDLSKAAQTYRIEIPGFTGAFKAISWMDGKHITQGVSMEGTTLVITHDAVKALGSGSGILRVYTQEETAYHLDATVATKIIYSLADLRSISVSGDRLDGYYLLGADVEGDGATVNLVGTYSADAGSGFIGTFDGRGHAISNINVGAGGLFYCTGAGTVKNLALVGITGTNRVLANEVHGTTFENIFISSKTCLRAITYAGKATIRNMLAVLPNGQDLVQTFGSVAESNAISNVYTVMAAPVTNNGWSGTKVEGFFNNYYKNDDPKSLYNLCHYRTVDELFSALDASNTLTAWNSSMSYASGAVLFDGKPVLTPEITVTGSVIAYRGQTTKLISSNAMFSLKGTVNGITVAADGTVTVAADVAEATEFTVVASHKKYTQQTVEWNMTVAIDYNKIDLTATEIEFDLSTNSSRYRCAIDGFEGTYKAIGWEGQGYIDASGISVRNGQLTITRVAMASIGSGSGTLCVYTEEENAYLLNVTIADKFIKTQEDLKSIAVSGSTLDGYYVLANDITCTEETFKLVGTWSASTETGFVGTFDGRGHVIDGYNGGTTGLFYCMGDRAVVKNVAFTNASGTNVLAGNEVHGASFENIFASGSAKYLTAKAWDSPSFENVIFVSDQKDSRLFLEGSNGVLSATNIFVVGEKLCYWGADSKQTNANVFSDVQSLMAAICTSGEMANWNGSGFGVQNSCLTFGGKTVLVPFEIQCEDSVSVGGTITAYAPSATFSLKEPVAGVYVDASTGVIRVDGTVAADTVFTVTAVSSKFPGYTAEKTVVVTVNWNDVDWTGTGSMADLVKDGGDVSVTLPAAISGNLMTVAYGTAENITQGIAVTDGVLTLSADFINTMYNAVGYGEHTIYLCTDAQYRYAIRVTLVTKVLKNQTDLQFIAIDGTLDGYFVLGNDIVCDGTTEIILAGYTSTTTGGFIGTFDGRGHIISNVNVGTQGFFRGIGAGTVKNVAFVNVISKNVNRTLANETHGCTFENVFVSSNAKYMLQSSWDSPSFKNVVFISSDAAVGRVFETGDRGTLTATNVFMVGQKLCYFGGTNNQTNVQAFTTVDALLTAISAENWTDSYFTYADGKLLFNGKIVAQ